MIKTKPRILIFVDAYLPGYRTGGPIRTVANVVEQLGDDFAFRIVTRDRERLDDVPYPDCRTATWQDVGKAEVRYVSPEQWTLGGARSLIRETPHDLVYLNSFFSPRYTLLPLSFQVAGAVPRKPTILAPRGELSPGALSLKKAKKRVFLHCAQLTGIYRRVIWHASAPEEEADIRRWFGEEARVNIAPNLCSIAGARAERHTGLLKQVGELKIVFLSRLSRKKNLHGALRLLTAIRGRVELNVFGPTEDAHYLAECARLAAGLPRNIGVKYQGSVPNSRVLEVLRRHHLFLLPTLGENFGHVIVEALSAGLPILISDRTPWRGLEQKGLGYDLPLEQPEAFQRAIQRFVDMDSVEYLQWSRRAVEFGESVANDPTATQRTRQLFLAALAAGVPEYGRA